MDIQIDEIFSLGLAILMGILAGKFAYRLKIPRVTGYLLMGLLIGPHFTNLIPEHVVHNLDVINDIALGLILFAIGNEFEWSHLNRIGIAKLLQLALFETLGVLVFVSGGFMLLGYEPVISLLVGSIAIATAPAATLLVVREFHSHGPLTDRLLALVAVNNILAMGLFRIIYSFVHLSNGADLTATILQPIYEIVVSVVLGILLGKILGFWERHLDELPELLLVIIGVILVGTGLARMLQLPPMMVAMAAGATIANSSYVHRLIYVEQRQLEQPIYIAFFVLAGLSLHVEMLLQMGFAGVVYLLARSAGKIGGIWLAGRVTSQPVEVSKFLGMTLLCQAGVAIGLSYEIIADYPEIGQMITTIVLATVILNETVGPYLVKLGLSMAHEVPEDISSQSAEVRSS
ncbi:cation:proton antiporter [bacterium]|nr:cation:proton antiporter [bacterium]